MSCPSAALPPEARHTEPSANQAHPGGWRLSGGAAQPAGLSTRPDVLTLPGPGLQASPSHASAVAPGSRGVRHRNGRSRLTGHLGAELGLGQPGRSAEGGGHPLWGPGGSPAPGSLPVDLHSGLSLLGVVVSWSVALWVGRVFLGTGWPPGALKRLLPLCACWGQALGVLAAARFHEVEGKHMAISPRPQGPGCHVAV